MVRIDVVFDGSSRGAEGYERQRGGHREGRYLHASLQKGCRSGSGVVKSVRRKLSREPVRGSTAGALGLEAALGEFLHQPVAVIALNLDAAVFDRAARAATFLQLGRQRFELVGGQAEAADHSDALALAALGFAADAHHAVGSDFARRAFFAHTFAYGTQAVGATLADVGRVNDAAAVGRALAVGRSFHGAKVLRAFLTRATAGRTPPRVRCHDRGHKTYASEAGMQLDRRQFMLALATTSAATSLGACALPTTQGEQRMHGLIGKMIAAPGKRDELIAILLESTTGMPGCLSYVIAKDPKDANAIWITEVWDNKDSHAASLTLPAVKAAIAKAKPIIAGFGDYVTTEPVGGVGLAQG